MKYYQPISQIELKDRLEKGQDICGYEIDWFLTIDFNEIEFNYRSQLRFSDCSFKFGANVFNLTSTEEFFDLKFDRCVFEHTGLNVRFSDISGIKVENCEMTHISISEGKGTGIEIKNTKCTEGCDIREMECHYLEVLQEQDLQFKLVYLRSPQLKYARISGVCEIERVLISHVEEAWLRGKIGTIDLRNDFKLVEIFELWDEEDKNYSNAHVKNLNFEHTIFQGQILISNTHIENLKFSELNATTAKVQFREVTIDQTTIADCSIANMVWNQLEFKTPPDLSGTDFTGLKMSNVQWPKNKRLKDSFLDEKIPLFYGWRKKSLERNSEDFESIEISDLRYQRDTYRQLKAASIANHNKIESLEFYKNEMILYWKEIRLVGGQAWYDRVLVFVNRWVSNFGQSWHMPFLWLFFFHTIFVLLIFKGELVFEMDAFWNGLGEYFYLINPAHKSPDYIDPGFDKIIEFFMRVFSGFFIFHFIKASRKFGKV